MGRFSYPPREKTLSFRILRRIWKRYVRPTNHRRTCPIRDSICSTEARATSGPPQIRRSSAWTKACGWPDFCAQAETSEVSSLRTSRRRRGSLTGADAAFFGCAAWAAWRLRRRVVTCSGSKSPGIPRKSASSSDPASAPSPNSPPSKSALSNDASDSSASKPGNASWSLACSSELARSRSSSSQPSSRFFSPRAWSRSTSI